MRYYYLDALRSSLMLLGVVYHAALIYSKIAWRVSDKDDTLFFDTLVDSTSSFRMPAFFIIAGFFTQLSLQRHGPIQFLKTRAMRILIPLFISLFTINAAMNYLFPCLAYNRVEPIMSYLGRLPESFISGHLNAHLWFLYYLFLYYILFLALRSVAKPLKRCLPPQSWLSRLDPTLVILPLALINVGMLIFRVQAKQIYFMRVLNTFEFYQTIWMFVYFLFGVWLYTSKTMYNAFCRVQEWHAVVFLGAFALMVGLKMDSRSKHAAQLLSYCQGIVTWTMCLFCFAAFKRWFDRPSKLWSYLSDASYTVYLFHLLFIVLGGVWLKQFKFSPYLKFSLLLTATLAITLLIHHFVILRFQVFRLCFNGKWKTKDRPRPDSPAGPQPPQTSEKLELDCATSK